MVEGRSNKEIGRRLDLAEKTVKHHVTNILQKTEGAQSRGGRTDGLPVNPLRIWRTTSTDPGHISGGA